MGDSEGAGIWYKLNDGQALHGSYGECTPLIVYILKYLWNKEFMDGSITVSTFSFYPMKDAYTS